MNDSAQGELPNLAALAIGGCYTSLDTSRWLNISEDQLETLRKERKYLAIQGLDREWSYPAWQFLSGSTQTIPGLTGILKMLSKGTDDEWTHALWLVGRMEDELDGKPAHEWLAGGGDIEQVLTLARRDAASWSAP